MRMRGLRRTLQMIVLAGLPAAGCSLYTGDDDSDCMDTVQRTFTLITPAEPSLQLLIESCRVDIDACPALCARALQDAGLGSSPTDCDVTFAGNQVDVEVAYQVWVGGDDCPVEGRRPAGLVAPRRPIAADRAAAWLAHATWLEAASIHAFVALAAELEQHGAPPALVRAALRAAGDEVRHTTMMGRLAARHGARPPIPEIARPAPRPLAALAVENAIEGCVRETWGAVIALWQAHAAPDREVRAMFAAIARDEARHAALAWAIDRWIAPRLDARERALVAAARTQAADELRAASPGEAIAALGLPDAGQAQGLVARTHEALWTGGHA